MKKIELVAEVRSALGKKSSLSSRDQSAVPAVVYGGKEENLHITVVENDFSKVINTPDVFLVELNIAGKIQQAIVKDVQFHPVTDKVLHIDFLRVFDGQEVVVELPLRTEGLAEGVKVGGALSILKRKVKVIGSPDKLPEFLLVNVTNLKLGETFKIGDFDYPELKFKDNDRVLVLSVAETRTSRMNKNADGDEAAAE